jgi:integrase
VRAHQLARNASGCAIVFSGDLPYRGNSDDVGEGKISVMPWSGIGKGHGLTQAGAQTMPERAFFADTKPTRTADTTRAYLKGGSVLLARALKKMTGPGDVIDAFCLLFEDPQLYRPSTTRLYKQQIKAVVARKLHDGEISRERAISGFTELKALLNARRGPCPKRTSRKKLKAPTRAEYRKLLADFTRRLRLPGGCDRADAVLPALVKVGPYLGLRPCEWLRATIADGKLHVVNAKGGNGRALGELRVIYLTGIPPKVVALVSHLIAQLRLLFVEAGSNWRKALGRLGERLARVCARIGIPRWSLYTTRHVAIAAWKRGGLSPSEIAALAGHSSTRTARQHYAGGRHGWTAEFACARPDPDLVAAILKHNGVKTAPVSAKIDAMTVALASAVTPTGISGSSVLMATIPHRAIAGRKHRRVPTIPIIKNDVVQTTSGLEIVLETDEAPAFGMG